MRLLLLTFIFLLFIPQAVHAENPAPPAAPAVITGVFKDLKNTTTGRVDKVIDAQTVLMKDGKIVHLLAIDYPMTTGDDIAPSMIVAKDRLAALLPESTEVLFYQVRNPTSADKTNRVNRMGHILAHLVKKQNNEWVNGTLVAEGLAWVETDSGNPQMAAQLYTLEQRAREMKKGLWAEGSPYGVLTPDTAAQGSGTFRIVEGTVNRAATSKNNLYLNFGDDWRKDFTVMISSDLRRKLARLNIDPMALSGKKIRIRGWLRDWNGPYMELETPERLEIVAMPQPSTEPPPEPSTDSVDNPLPHIQGLKTGQPNP